MYQMMEECGGSEFRSVRTDRICLCFDGCIHRAVFCMTRRLCSAAWIVGSKENSGGLTDGGVDLMILWMAVMNHGGVPVV